MVCCDMRRGSDMCLLFIELVLLLSVQLVHTQVPVLTVETVGPYSCGTSLELRCTPASCCTSLSKIWYKGTTPLISSGSSINAEKYTEQDSASHFKMTILNLAESDFGSDYSCTYAGQPSNSVALNITDYNCDKKKCDNCEWYCLGYSLIGFILTVIGAWLIIYFCIDSVEEERTKILIIATSVSLAVTVIFGPVVGKTTCLCDDGKGPLCILIGFISIVVFVIVLLVFKKKGSGGADSSGSRFTCCRGNTVCAGPNPGEPSDRRPPQGVRRPEIRESAQAGAHTRTENSSPKKNEYASKLDSVPKGRPLPQIGGNSPRELPQLDQGKNNITKLDPLVVFEDPGEKKKKKKKRKKQQENDEVET